MAIWVGTWVTPFFSTGIDGFLVVEGQLNHFGDLFLHDNLVAGRKPKHVS